MRIRIRITRKGKLEQTAEDRLTHIIIFDNMRRMEKDKYDVIWKRKVDKQIARMPVKMQDRFGALISDIRKTGPVQAEWPNFSTLGKERYHCHIGYNWIVCWTCKKNTVIVEVYYAGSRENAPY